MWHEEYTQNVNIKTMGKTYGAAKGDNGNIRMAISPVHTT